MKLLDIWRDSVVRDGDRFHIMPDGCKLEKCLTKTCLDCHVSKVKFCDACHSFASVKPYCWECHVIPMSGEHNQFSKVERDDFIKNNIHKKNLVKNNAIKKNPLFIGVTSD